MFEYEIAATARTADLLREAAAYRTVRDAGARRASLRHLEPRGSVRALRSRFARTAGHAPHTA
ncbi:hypothetical protein [Streptomyces sp. NRRL F-2580]|uniref:hypothetical protein n=1 Tax=Streptomyces sp. NRRL F-2580 TaxID=1463841 RepID=UPI0004CAADD5|nr:hypothetical protein [Streptomyces sp. NRRL F-2580]